MPMEPVITIAALPDDTLIYPGHDYTEENYEFALTIEPDNKVVAKYLQAVKEYLSNNETMGEVDDDGKYLE